MNELQVASDLSASSHDFMLDDGAQQWFFNLADLVIDQQPSTPNNVFDTGGDGGEFGRFTPDHAHLLQRDWGGGRGQYDWEDNTKYLDSREAWTLIPGKVTPVPQHKYQQGFGEGATDAIVSGSEILNSLPGAIEYNVAGAAHERLSDDMRMIKLTAQDKYALQANTPSNVSIGSIYLYIRQIGIPSSTLTCEIADNTAGSPGTVRWTGTISADSRADDAPIIKLREFRAAEYSITANDDPFIVIYGSGAGDDDNNHWEVGIIEGGSRQGHKDAASGGSWSHVDEQICFLASKKERANQDREIIPFEYFGALYAIQKRLDGTASKLFINGDRGVADVSSTTTVVDGTKSWPVDIFVGATVRLVEGTGKRQVGVIISNTATTLTIAATEDWGEAPDTTTEYVIRGSDVWQEVTLSGDGIDDMVTDFVVTDNTVYFAFGNTGSVMLRWRWDSAAHTGDDEPNSKKADYLEVHQDDTGNVQLWAGHNTTAGGNVFLEHWDIPSWGSGLGTSPDIDVGDDSAKITGLLSHEGRLWVFKEDKPYYLSQNYALPVEVGLESMFDQNNGRAHAAWKRDIYFAWSYSVEKMRGVTVDDIGPWKGSGLPQARRGKISSILPIHAFMMFGINAGPNRTSSVLFYNEIGYGELYRAPSVGHKIRNVFWDSVPGGNDRVLIDVGDFLFVSLEFPDDTLNFLEDSTFKYHHQWVIESSTYDMQAQQLSKLFKALTLTTDNLDYKVKIHCQYQVDGKVGSTEWQTIGDYYESPHQSLPIDEGRRKKIRIRFIGTTEDATVPPVMEAAVLEGFARTPVKYNYPLNISTKKLASSLDGYRANPDDFVSWLIDASQEGGELELHASPGFALLDELDVVILPPAILRQYRNRKDGQWEGNVRLVVRDA